MVAPRWTFGRFTLLPASRELLAEDSPVNVGARAFDVLVALIERRNRLVGKDELLDVVWPGLVVEENNLQVQISALRKVLGPQAIATVPGRGYRFTLPLSETGSGGAVPAPAVATAARLDAPIAPATNLPADLPPLFGRADDMAALRTMLDAHRLVTVAGAGGIGKTALAQAVAHEARGSYDDGVWLVELASVPDPALVASSVAGVLRLTLNVDAPAESLAGALRTSRMLIVLDNCEHLLVGVAAVADALYRSAPHVRLLATSQEPLRIAQEQVYRLGTLEVPDTRDLVSARTAGAVALFAARARAADPRFALTEDNAGAVLDICRHLDGIALAIELAAARVPLLGVDGVRAKLNERFRILTGGARLALRRHQTLRAALEWSHGLLTADEQTVFRRLGAFVGSFGLASAQRVAADDTIDEWSVLDRLGALVDKSLVVAEIGEPPRYRLLETTRAYALEMLQGAGETDSVMRKHAEAVCAVFERSRAEEFVHPMQARLDRYLPDLDNARTALDWLAGAPENADLHVALAGAMGWMWVSAGLRPEGMRRIAAAIERVGAGTPPHLEGRLLSTLTYNAFPVAGPREHAADARAVLLLRAAGDHHALYRALCRQAITFIRTDRLDAAESILHEADSMFAPDWPPATRAELLIACGWLHDRREQFAEGLAPKQELLTLALALDDQRMVMTAMISLEQGLAALGRLDESIALGRDLVERMRRDRLLRSGIENVVLSNLAMSLARAGEIDEALAFAREAFPAVQRAGRMQELLDPNAFLALKRGRPDDAARIVGRAQKRFAGSTVLRDFVEEQLHDQVMEELHSALAPEALTLLLLEGEDLSDDEAVRLALRA